MITCLVLEDEKPAQKILENYIQRTSFLICKGYFSFPGEVEPDLVKNVGLLFLDVQLPGLNGISYLKTIAKPPAVIITSAFPTYAIEAFETQTIDYLVKPFSYERFLKAVNRVVVSEKSSNISERTSQQQDIFINTDKTIYKISSADIVLLKADVDYIRILTIQREFVLLDSLSAWEEKLKPFGLIRVHRSYMVNKSMISKIQGNEILLGSITVPIGRTYREEFINSLRL